MSLPPLPRQNKSKEADFGVYFRQWIEKNYSRLKTSSLEMKYTDGKEYLLFSEVKALQIAYGNKISSDKGCLIRVIGSDGQPDYIWMRNEPAYVVIRYPKFFCLVTIGNLVFERDNHKRKSLTADRAKDIATFWVPTKT